MVDDGSTAPRRWRRPISVSPSARAPTWRSSDVVLMRSDPLDVPIALQIGRGTLRKMRQNLGWAVGYNAIAPPIAAEFAPALGLAL
jgi:P-type Cu2+ transporter